VKIFIILIVVIILIGGGGLAALKSMEIGPFAPEDELSKEEAAKKEPSIFIDVEPLLINVFQDNQVITVIQIVIKLETRGKDNASFVNQQLPKITDTLLQDLHSFIPRVMKNEDAKLDVFVLKKRLTLIVHKLLPEREVYDVLIQSVSEG
jgi:flagellar basal body-associated protein FliL